MVMAGESELSHDGPVMIVRTPGEPTYWFGNFLICPGDMSADELLKRFSNAFPASRHICLRFDDPAGSQLEVHGALQDAGLELDIDEVLVSAEPLSDWSVPEGFVIRPIQSESDWGQVIAAQHAIGVEQGYGAGTDHQAYVEARFARVRAQVDAGMGRWFGAFDGDTLAADLGIYVNSELARYQNVETVESYRGRGLCHALVCHAGRWARKSAGSDIPLVIVALADGPAGRIYRHCGFAPKERLISAVKPGY